VDNNCKAELVITPPKQYGDQLAQRMSARTTLGVLTQLVAGAEVHIMIASPFFQASEGVEANPLASALKFATYGVLIWRLSVPEKELQRLKMDGLPCLLKNVFVYYNPSQI